MFRIFYRKTVVLNRDAFSFKNACIVVSNHPSTLTDPLHVANKTAPQLFFLANAGLFESKIGGWFFNTFYCIPVERPKDVQGRRIQNDDAFKRCDEHLSKNGSLYIAPQGFSKMVRRLSNPVKTGTARIALSAESKNDFNLGLTILPVGLTYTNSTEFRSGIVINTGSHIKVANYKSIYLEDPVKAVKQLTKDLEDHLRTLILDTEDEEEELLLERMEAILDSKNPLPLKEHFLRTKKLITPLHQLKEEAPAAYQKLSRQTTQHFAELDQATVSVKSVFQQMNSVKNTLFLILGFPFFAYGWVNNFLANFIPAFITKKVNTYAGYDSTIKLMSGLFTYPIFYGLQIFLVHRFCGNLWITLAYVISLPVLGLLAWAYRKYFIKVRKWNRWEKVKKESPEKGQLILDTQTELAAELNRLLLSTH